MDETPLGPVAHVAHTFSRPATASRFERLASLEAEVERLRGELANDADDTAGMLVRIAESERRHLTAQSMAVEASARATALEAEIGQARQRIDELERELDGLRRQWGLSEARLNAARESTETALALVDELERREEMAAAIRARTIAEVLETLRGNGTPRAPQSSVEIVGPREADWDLDLAK